MDHSAALDLLAELHAGRIARCWLLAELHAGRIARCWLLAELHAGRIARCWLLPLDPVEFDDIWSGVTA